MQHQIQNKDFILNSVFFKNINYGISSVYALKVLNLILQLFKNSNFFYILLKDSYMYSFSS